jgi:hypothetical protein
MKNKIFSCLGFCLMLIFVIHHPGNYAWAIDTGWMQQGVRIWYFGGVDGTGPSASNAGEAYLITDITDAGVQVTRHAALTHWTSPQPVQNESHPIDKGPCWIHPVALQNLKMGDYWMGQEITLITSANYTYETFPYRLLPAKALFDLKPVREFVKLSYMIPGFSVGNAYFDAETGLLLYYHALWGANKMFFILSEINYDFAVKKAFAEDYGPHSGFKSFVSQQSMWDPSGPPGGGSVIIQSLVETRYGQTIEMVVISSISGPSILLPTRYENYCFFGHVPILRYMDMEEAPNYPLEQWTPIGQYLWWWIPPKDLTRNTINVLDIPMTRTSSNPIIFNSTQSPDRFHFSMLQFDSLGYLTLFAAKDPTIGLDLNPGDWLFQNHTTVDGLDYYVNVMGRAVPQGTQPEPQPAQPVSLPGIMNLLLMDEE